MCHSSPSTFLLWGILATTLCAFLVSHLWSFDRFRCLKWSNNGPGAGAFKRVMTYTYLLSVPLLVVYSVGFAVVKYQEGWILVPELGVIPKPYQLWSHKHQQMIAPLQMFLSVAWGLEIVTHLEELCFWLFLLRSSDASKQVSWFRSWHFRLWVVGSLLGAIGVPLTTHFKSHNPLEAEAWTFLVASSCSLVLTLLFLPVLWRFPHFLSQLKADGTQRRVVMRLVQFHDLNIIRVVFRFAFVLPFLALGIDGVLKVHYLNERLFWTDLLAMAGALGCITSSVLTLLIFFPRNLENEAGYVKSTRQHSTAYTAERRMSEKYATQPQLAARPISAWEPEAWEGVDAQHVLPMHQLPAPASNESLVPLDPLAAGPMRMLPPARVEHHYVARYPPMKPHSRFGGAVPEQQQQQQQPREEDGEVAKQRTPHYVKRQSRMHPMVHNYRSPIDLIDTYYQTNGGMYV